MENKDLEKLITYKNGELLLDGFNLEKAANMFKFSVKDYLKLFKMYLIAKNDWVNDKYIISYKERDVFDRNSNIIYEKNNGVLLVSKDDYENMKKKAFVFAYKYCSDISRNNFIVHKLNEGSEKQLIKVIEICKENYSCIYKNSFYGWNQKVSPIKIDNEDLERRYSLIKK